MPAYKDENKNTWFASFYYEDWTGERKRKVKRGFKTRREAKDWEQSFLENKAGTMEMTFAEFYDLYTEDMKPRLRHNTWCTKDYIVQEKILPYFGKKRMCDIKTSDIIKWQNKLMVMKDDEGKFSSRVYVIAEHVEYKPVLQKQEDSEKMEEKTIQPVAESELVKEAVSF